MRVCAFLFGIVSQEAAGALFLRVLDELPGRALHPDILCFDEPTSALDPELTGEVLRVLRDLADRKTTMIIVTHEMNFARDVADRILFMDGGVVVEQGPARQLIEHPQEERTRRFLACLLYTSPSPRDS